MEEMAFPRDFRQVQEEMETSVTLDEYHRLTAERRQRLRADVNPMSDPHEARSDLRDQPRQPINAEATHPDPGEWQKEMPDGTEEKEMAEEDTSLDPYWRPADGPCVALPSRKRSRKRLTKEEREQERERRKTHRTKAWFERQLLAVANGEVVMTPQQYKALIAFGRVRGWNRRPPDKRSGRFLR